MELVNVMRKLVGPIQPLGESHTDSVRLENLKVMVEVVDLLLGDIKVVAMNKDRPEASMKKAGVYADLFLAEVRDADQPHNHGAEYE